MASLTSHIPGAIAWSLAALATYTTITFIYNVFFHPLRNVPGPLFYRGSRLPRTLRILKRAWTRDILDLAKEYGPVVRVAPNVLVYTAPEAWKDIYGHSQQNGAVVKGEEFGKDPQMYRARDVAPNILSETRDNHALLRRQLAHGFSEKTLREQESIIKGYVDLFIKGLRDRCVAPSEKQQQGDNKLTTKATSFDMRHWFNYITFDIIGDLAMGEPFGCLEKGELDERVAFFEKGIQTASLAYSVKQLGLERYMAWVARAVFNFRKMTRSNMAAVLRRRMDLTMERPDLIEGLLKKQDDWNIPFETLRSNVTILIVAGSETTATILTGVIFLLMKNPECLERLKKEVRSAYKSEDEITFSSVEHLDYMLACLKEGLRFYPPVAGELARVVPKGGAHIAGGFVPEGTTVSISQYAINHVESNFSEPSKFDPERFLAPEKYPHDAFDALQPFSAGPRNCIGKNLAYAEMRIIMARLIYNFDMELVDPEDNWMDQKVFFLWTKPPLNVYLTPVQR